MTFEAWDIWSEWCLDKKQQDNKKTRQKDSQTKIRVLLWCLGGLTLLRCLYHGPRISWIELHLLKRALNPIERSIDGENLERKKSERKIFSQYSSSLLSAVGQYKRVWDLLWRGWFTWGVVAKILQQENFIFPILPINIWQQEPTNKHWKKTWNTKKQTGKPRNPQEEPSLETRGLQSCSGLCSWLFQLETGCYP